MGRAGRALVRVAVFALTTVGLSLLLGWLLEVVPWVAWVLAALSLVLLVRSVLRVVRDPRPVLAVGTLVLTLLLGWGVATAVEAVVGGPTTSELALADPDAPDGGDAGDEEGGGGPLDDDAVAEDGGDPGDDGPADDPEQPEPTASAEPAELGPGSVTSLAVGRQGTATTLSVGTDGGRPAELWVTTVEAAGRPLQLVHDGGWQLVDGPANARVTVLAEDGEGGVTLAVEGLAAGHWAVVDDDGDRVPVVGHAPAPGEDPAALDGVLAARLADELAVVESALPTLTEEHRAFVLSLLARQVRPGSFVLERTLAADPDGDTIELAFTVGWPRFSQRVVAAADTGVWVTDEAVLSCDPDGCDPAETVLPVSAAAAIAADPDATSLVFLPLDTDPTGDAVDCVEVLAVPPGGPSTGTSCWRADGLATLIERDDVGDRLVLVDSSPTVDEDDLEPPT